MTYKPGSQVDVTIRGARVSSIHVQDRRLFLVLPDGRDIHLPLPLDQSVAVEPHADRLSVRGGDLQRLIADRIHDAHCTVPDCIARSTEERYAAIAIEALVDAGLLDYTNDQASASPIADAEAASPLSDQSQATADVSP